MWLEKERNKRIAILISAIVGLLLTIKLCIIYYDSNFNPYALSSFCSVSEFIDCDGVAKTTHSQFFGIPLCIWGLIFYCIVILFLFVKRLKNIFFLRFLEVFKNPYSYICTLGVIAFSISMILFFVSLFEIKKLCVLCFATYLINLLIAFLAKDMKAKWYYEIFESYKDFIDGIKQKKYLISFLLCTILGIIILIYFKFSYILIPQVKMLDSINEFRNVKGNPYKVSGNILGDTDAKIMIYEYTDFECPHCTILDMMLQRLVSELEGIKIIHKNFPIDKHCNRYIPSSMHENSCLMARYAISAQLQDKYWEFNNILFENKPKTVKELKKLAKSVNLDVERLERDSNSETVSKMLKDDIDEAYSLKIEGTPTLVINGKAMLGLKPYYEIKKIVMDLGAKERRK